MQICCVQEDYRIPIQQPITYEGSLGFYKLIAAFAKIKEIDVNPTTITVLKIQWILSNNIKGIHVVFQLGG